MNDASTPPGLDDPEALTAWLAAKLRDLSAKNGPDGFPIALAALAAIVHHRRFKPEIANLAPLAVVGVTALGGERPNVALAMEVVFELEGRLVMETEVARLGPGKRRPPPVGVSTVDVARHALPLSFLIFLGVLAMSNLLGWALDRGCAWAGWACMGNPMNTPDYNMAVFWGMLGGTTSVMLGIQEVTRLRGNQLRGYYYAKIYRPWVGAIFAALLFFAVKGGLINSLVPGDGLKALCFWGIVGFAAGFSERLVPDLIGRFERSQAGREVRARPDGAQPGEGATQPTRPERGGSAPP